MRSRVAIIGAGISGLSTAYYLNKYSAGQFDIQIFEASHKVGGKLQTSRHGDFLVEHGPDSIFTNKPWAYQLLEELGIHAECIDPSARSFSIQRDGKLYPVPMGILKPYPDNLKALFQCNLISLRGKISAGSRILKKRLTKGKESERISEFSGTSADLSLREYLRDNWGREVAEYLFEPLYAGVHAGDAQKLSMKALYPHFLDPKNTPEVKGHRRGFVALRDGMKQVIEALCLKLSNTEIHVNCEVLGVLNSSTGGFELETVKGVGVFDFVVFALPGYLVPPILESTHPELCKLLSKVKHISSAVATFAFMGQEKKFLKFGSGFIVPSSEDRCVSGCTISSSKWKNRAPEGSVLVRIFLRTGVNGTPLEDTSDQELLQLAFSCLETHLGSLPQAVFSRIDRWENGVPQYEMGHLALMEQIEKERESTPDIFFTGVSFGGIGIPDCVRQGEETARKLLNRASLNFEDPVYEAPLYEAL